MSLFFAPVIRTRAVVPGLRSFDRSFERFVNDAFFTAAPSPAPQSREDDRAWTVSLDLPGIKREDLSISIEGKVLRIETRPEAARPYKAAYELPQEIDVDATRAKLEDGVLTLNLAKLQPVSRARQVPLE